MKFKPEDIVVINLSGRGDKDLNTYIDYFNCKGVPASGWVGPLYLFVKKNHKRIPLPSLTHTRTR
jgi:hypothetical protein